MSEEISILDKVFNLIKNHYAKRVIDSDRICMLLGLSPYEWKGIETHLLAVGAVETRIGEDGLFLICSYLNKTEESMREEKATLVSRLRKNIALYESQYRPHLKTLQKIDKENVDKYIESYNFHVMDKPFEEMHLEALIRADFCLTELLQMLINIYNEHEKEKIADSLMRQAKNFQMSAQEEAQQEKRRQVLFDDLTIFEVSKKIQVLFDNLPLENKFSSCRLTRAEVFEWVFTADLKKYHNRSHVLSTATKLIQDGSWHGTFRKRRQKDTEEITNLKIQVASRDKEIAILNHENLLKNKLLYENGEPLPPREKEEKVLN